MNKQTNRLWAVLCAGSLAACSSSNGGNDASTTGNDAATVTDTGTQPVTDSGTTPDDAVAPADGATGTDAATEAAVGDGSTGDGAISMTLASCVQNGGESCFVLPTAPIQGEIIGDAGNSTPDFSCSAPEMYNSTAAVPVSGRVTDFQSGGGISGATVDVFGDDNYEATPLATATTDSNGAFMFTLPAGTPNILDYRTRATGAFETYGTHQVTNLRATSITGADRQSIANSTATGIASIISLRRAMGTGVIAGSAMDCHKHDLYNVIATLSSTSSAGGAPPTFVPSAIPYYFAGGNGLDPLPVSRGRVTATGNANGLFVFFQVPPTTGTNRVYVQLWGFRTAADIGRGRAGLTLVSEVRTRILADALIAPEMSPLHLAD